MEEHKLDTVLEWLFHFLIADPVVKLGYHFEEEVLKHIEHLKLAVHLKKLVHATSKLTQNCLELDAVLVRDNVALRILGDHIVSKNHFKELRIFLGLPLFVELIVVSWNTQYFRDTESENEKENYTKACRFPDVQLNEQVNKWLKQLFNLDCKEM